MKKYIIIRIAFVVLITSVLLMMVSGFLQLQAANDNFLATATIQAEQIVDLLTSNNEDIQELQEELKLDYIVRAKATAYLLYNSPQTILDMEELLKITELLQIDEIHIFDKQGEIYAGTVPDYYGFTFNSGEQMSFFLPLLDDYELELAQDVTPNTAEQKDMQYVAVWGEDNEYIVQIGIEPIRLLTAMKETEIEYIFSRFVPAPGTVIYAVDCTTGDIVSATDSSIIDKKASEIGVNRLEILEGDTYDIATELNGVHGRSVLMRYDTILIGVNVTNATIFDFALQNFIVVIATGIILGVIVIVLIYLIIDKKILTSLLEISKGVDVIASGNMEHEMVVKGFPEFVLLSKNINTMVKKIVALSGKLTSVLQHVNLPIALYEQSSNKIVVTSKMFSILNIKSQDANENLLNTEEFLNKLNVILQNPFEGEKDVFVFKDENDIKYLKIKQDVGENNSWGFLLDVTEEIEEKKNIIFERDMDVLTGIKNRRAFMEALKELEDKPELINKATVIMLDLDNLKYVNDTWGHATGDAFIKKAAHVLRDFSYKHKVVSRLSGDEFVAFLYNAQTYEELDEQVDLLKKSFQEAYIETKDNGRYNVKISAGYAFYPQQSKSFKDILNLADKAMYKVKYDSKNDFRKYVEE